MFHDFEIVDIIKENDVLTLETVIPWGELWDIENYKLTFKFSGCKSLKCVYLKRTSNELVTIENASYYPTVSRTTEDFEEIKKLELNIQRHSFASPNIYTLYCNSFGDGVESGTLEFTTDNFQIFDNEHQLISLDKMKDAATEWWKSIEDMWRNEKKT